MIVYNNRSSDEFGITITKGVTFDSPSRNLESVKIMGRDGELKIGDGSLMNVQKSFPFVVRDQTRDIAQIATDISNWLKADAKWHWLSFSGDDEYFYQAMAIEEYGIERVVSWFGRGTIDFEMKPYKFLKTGFVEIKLGQTIYNPLSRPSKPKLTIHGTGDIRLKIGEEILELKEIEDGIIVDTLYQVVTTLDGKQALWDKVYSYPLLQIPTGLHEVEVTGNVTEIHVIPRWEAIV